MQSKHGRVLEPLFSDSANETTDASLLNKRAFSKEEHPLSESDNEASKDLLKSELQPEEDPNTPPQK